MIGAVCRPAPSLVITLALRERIAAPGGRVRPCINAGWPETCSISESRGSEQLRDSRFPMLRQVYAPLLIRFTEPETHGVLQHQQDHAGHDE